jgi:hypothetical protein
MKQETTSSKVEWHKFEKLNIVSELVHQDFRNGLWIEISARILCG